MNLFKKILSGNQDTKQPAPTGPAYSPRMEEVLEELPELNKGMSLDVVTKDGKLLLTGRISAVTAAGLTLERMPGWLAFDTVNIGETVNLRGFTKQMLAFNLSGTVRESSRIIFRVQNLRVEHVINQRLTFRLPINGPAYLFRQDDERFARPEECTLVDISTGGACVESEYVHEEDEVLYLRFKLEDYPTMTFLGQIVRGAEYSSSRYRYGILFAQLKQEEITTLTRTLYNIQTGNRKEWSRGMEGGY